MLRLLWKLSLKSLRASIFEYISQLYPLYDSNITVIPHIVVLPYDYSRIAVHRCEVCFLNRQNPSTNTMILFALIADRTFAVSRVMNSIRFPIFLRYSIDALNLWWNHVLFSLHICENRISFSFEGIRFENSLCSKIANWRPFTLSGKRGPPSHLISRNYW